MDGSVRWFFSLVITYFKRLQNYKFFLIIFILHKNLAHMAYSEVCAKLMKPQHILVNC
jgi:hypothetical protein